MRKTYFYLFVILSLFYLSSCSEKENFENNDTYSYLSFGFDLNESLLSKSTEFSEECLEKSELIKLANENKLFARISIEGISNDLVLKIKVIENDILMTESSSFKINSLQTEYTIIKALITDDQDNTLYSGIGVNSKFNKYVPENELMGNKKFTIYPENRFQTIVQSLYVFCAVNLTPQDFGYVNWGTSFLKIYDIPVKVTDCNKNAPSEKIILNGFIKVEYKLAGASDYTTLHESLQFGSDLNLDNSICFKDDYDIDNVDEKYRISISVNDLNDETIVKSVEVTGEDLLNFKEYEDKNGNKAWDSEANLIHIDICSNSTWIFDFEEVSEPDEPDQPGYEPKKLEKLILSFDAESYEESMKQFQYYDDADNKWRDIPKSFITTENFLNFKAGMKIRTKDRFLINKVEGSQSPYIGIKTSIKLDNYTVILPKMVSVSGEVVFSQAFHNFFNEIYYSVVYISATNNNEYYFIELYNRGEEDVEISYFQYKEGLW